MKITIFSRLSLVGFTICCIQLSTCCIDDATDFGILTLSESFQKIVGYLVSVNKNLSAIIESEFYNISLGQKESASQINKTIHRSTGVIQEVLLELIDQQTSNITSGLSLECARNSLQIQDSMRVLINTSNERLTGQERKIDNIERSLDQLIATRENQSQSVTNSCSRIKQLIRGAQADESRTHQQIISSIQTKAENFERTLQEILMQTESTSDIANNQSVILQKLEEGQQKEDRQARDLVDKLEKNKNSATRLTVQKATELGQQLHRFQQLQNSTSHQQFETLATSLQQLQQFQDAQQQRQQISIIEQQLQQQQLFDNLTKQFIEIQESQRPVQSGQSQIKQLIEQLGMEHLEMKLSIEQLNLELRQLQSTEQQRQQVEQQRQQVEQERQQQLFDNLTMQFIKIQESQKAGRSEQLQIKQLAFHLGKKHQDMNVSLGQINQKLRRLQQTEQQRQEAEQRRQQDEQRRQQVEQQRQQQLFDNLTMQFIKIQESQRAEQSGQLQIKQRIDQFGMEHQEIKLSLEQLNQELAQQKQEQMSNRQQTNQLLENQIVIREILQVIRQQVMSTENQPQKINNTTDCVSLKREGRRSGVYPVKANNASETRLDVYCDMDTTDGGWTVIQRRKDGSVDFYRNWADYKRGFGNLTEEFWIGNDYLSDLTRGGVRLRVDMTKTGSGTRGWAEYSSFSVDSEANNYRLSVGGYTGNAGDSLSALNGITFSTVDRDNDGNIHVNKAATYTGAWWFKRTITPSNLNGQYIQIPTPGTPGHQNFWNSFHQTNGLQFVEMKIKSIS